MTNTRDCTALARLVLVLVLLIPFLSSWNSVVRALLALRIVVPDPAGASLWNTPLREAGQAAKAPPPNTTCASWSATLEHFLTFLFLFYCIV